MAKTRKNRTLARKRQQCIFEKFNETRRNVDRNKSNANPQAPGGRFNDLLPNHSRITHVAGQQPTLATLLVSSPAARALDEIDCLWLLVSSIHALISFLGNDHSPAQD